MKSVIYKILNKVTNKYYVGSAICWITRKKRHKYLLRHSKHVNTHLQNSWNKHGEDNFEFLIVEDVQDPKNLLIREQYYLDLNVDGFNICRTAGNCLGRICSEVTRDKIAAGQIGRTHSVETKKLMRAAKLGISQTADHVSKRVNQLTDFYKSGSGNKGKFGHSNSKAIIQMNLNGEFVKRWPSSLEIYRETGFNCRNIRSCCSGTLRSKAHGFKWKFETV